MTITHEEKLNLDEYYSASKSNEECDDMISHIRDNLAAKVGMDIVKYMRYEAKGPGYAVMLNNYKFEDFFKPNGEEFKFDEAVFRMSVDIAIVKVVTTHQLVEED